MAVTKNLETLSLTIEIQNGVDKAGDPTYAKKTFANVKNDVNIENVYAVADAIKGILSAKTRSYFLNETSSIVQG
ncbi:MULTISPECIES: DUF1659 domain-containing protein [Clostridium]|uniref:DUF1659 domain-containing protein n=1 Tax=Clostridium TaxID=1485 RepID=UPI00098C48DE|nr:MULTISPECIES: DUF1659 domain-containing protein [Clostridium]MBN7576480.1 DUF1659 domain-containing protein [Clostridium beijerinckii]MBN7581470.1 DUF1659 domain-containing protein [Clostridium beijerinckii]MBN7586237.1 DUF1659 domain-containing protein [Clostridium beijerinckii]MBO0522296.1 DUF1659 domain-containing protein [Clostridium beijerinckii]NRT35432.1 hypothetical protein [Clostridium beijerinckii]